MINQMKVKKDDLRYAFACEGCIDFLRALADETRQQIIMFFIDKQEMCANEIAGKFILSRPTISHHLNMMKRTKILNSRKEGKEIYYSINKDFIKRLLTGVLENIGRCC